MIEFEYKGKIYYTENLDKKLKRLKIKSQDEIKIITENSTHGQKKPEDPEGDNIVYYPRVYIWNDKDNIIINKIWDPNIPANIDNLCKQPYWLWDFQTNTGTDKRFTLEWCKQHLHILKNTPKFPINIINGLPELESEQNEWVCY